VLRPSLARALRSVFAQELTGRIQVLIGIDHRQGDAACLDRVLEEKPAHVSVLTLDLGYSTSSRHGGIYANHYSGALRTILSYAANSKYVAYLDDDDWWAADHLSGLLSAIGAHDWAYSYRWLVDRQTGWPICRDEWDSVGPGHGVNLERFGGFVGPSTLLLDKGACHFVLPNWSLSPSPDGASEDRLVFAALVKLGAGACSGKFSSFYEMSREVQSHTHHARAFTARRIRWVNDPDEVAAINGFADAAASALDRGKPEAAIAACQRALALNRYHPTSLRLLAEAKSKKALLF